MYWVAAAVAALVVAILAWFFFARRSGGGAVHRDLVLLWGPNDAGKTVLHQRLARGVIAETVGSAAELVYTGPLVSDGGDATGALRAKLIDVPGFPQMRERALAYAPSAAGIVFVLDAAAEYNPAKAESHYKAAADLLYELFTSAPATAAATPLLIACNKMDLPQARSVEQIRALLETELELLKASRPSIAVAGDDTSRPAPLLLGQAGAKFSFETDAPLPVSWCGIVASAAAAGAASGVLAFVREVVR